MNGHGVDVWSAVLLRLKERVSPDNYNLWFASLQCDNTDAQSQNLVVSAPNPFMKDWITDYYLDIIKSELTEVAGPGWNIDVMVNTSRKQARKLVNFNVETTPAAAAEPLNPKPARPRGRPVNGSLHLNPRYTFDTFVVGDSNAIAHAAAISAAMRPGRSYNPLFLHASTGLGKTHLLQAVAHGIREHNPEARIAYLSAETFMNDLIGSIRKGEMESFHNRFRNGCDVLLIDDIQFIAGKSSTQEEFFHTFNFLHDQGKQIVLTADNYPKEIKDLDDRLRSRFQSGLVADIKPPQIETRIAILRKKAEVDNIPLPEDVALLIGQGFAGNVRELEGALIRVEAFANLTGRPISAELAKEALKNYLQLQSNKMDAEGIIKTVCSYYSVKPLAIRGKGRAQKVVFPRQVSMYLLKKFTKLSLQEIGSSLGGRDHSTVLHSLSKIERMILEDVRVQHEIEALQKQIERESRDS